MAFDKDAFLTALDSMTVLELNDLVKAIEEKFGVSAAAGHPQPPQRHPHPCGNRDGPDWLPPEGGAGD